MREIRLIFPILFKSMFRKREGEKSSSSNIVAYVVLGVIFGGYSVLGAIGMIPAFFELKSVDLIGSFLALLFTITSVANLFFAIMPLVTTLYFSNDTEYFLSLPVKPQSVYVSKILMVYVSQTYIAGIIALPMIIVLGIALGMNAFFYLVGILGVFLTPLFAIMISSILAAPIMYLVRVIKSKNVVTSIFAILAFALVMGGYMYLTLGMANEETDMTQMAQMLINSVKSIGEIVVPLTALGNLATISSMTPFGELPSFVAPLVNLAIVVLFFGIIIAVCWIISARFYKTGVSYMLEHKGIDKKKEKVIKSKKLGFTAKSVRQTLLKTEILSMIRTPAFAFNCLGCLIIIPIFSAFMAYMMSDSIGEMGNEFAYGIVFSLMCGMTMSMNIGACSSFSREGERFVILKIAPIDRKALVKMKVTLYSSLLIVTFLISAIISIIITQVSFLHVLSLIPSSLIMIGTTAMDILWDLKKPNLSWVNPTDAVKNGSNVLVPTFVCMGFMFVFMIVFVVGVVLFPAYALLMTYVIIGIIGLILTLIFTNKLFQNCDEYIERVEI